MTNELDLYQRLTEKFRQQNDLDAADITTQWSVVEEEIDEMNEEFKTLRKEHIPHFGSDGWKAAAGNPPVERLAEEMVDAIYTIHLAARMLDIDLRERYREKAEYNLEKSGERDENGKIIDDAEVGDGR